MSTNRKITTNLKNVFSAFVSEIYEMGNDDPTQINI
jgi:hypothetical protein